MASHGIPFDAVASDDRNRLAADNERLRQQLRDRHRLSDLAGHSRAIREVSSLVAQVAPTHDSVCLRGEDGVGKTRTARALHAGSPRAAEPFVVVRCAAMADTTVDAQLFGPSGPPQPAPVGCVGRAGNGTLFFDEVTDLGPLAQARLATALIERSWELPDGRHLPNDVRIIAASRQPIESLTASGRFRADLWQVLETLTITLPPLRSRKVDLPILVDLFVEEFAREYVRRVRGVSSRAMDMLMDYEWPGNVTELRDVIERAVILTTGPIIHHHHLPAEIQDAAHSHAVPAVGLSDALDAYEKELLQDALRQARGARSQAARLLMTSERVFSYRLRKHGIDSRRFKTP